MPEYCTCGATLAENARFCHMCGRPTFEMPAAVASENVPAPSPVPTPTARPPLPVTFNNPIALRVSFLMSLGIMLAQMIPGVNLLFVVWWLAAGAGAVLLYRRLTGLALSVKAGARLGSITGVLTFVSMAIIFALTMVFMGKDVFQQMAKQDPQISQILNDPASLVAVFSLVLVLTFAMVVGTCAAGGALGARFAGRRGANT